MRSRMRRSIRSSARCRPAAVTGRLYRLGPASCGRPRACSTSAAESSRALSVPCPKNTRARRRRRAPSSMSCSTVSLWDTAVMERRSWLILSVAALCAALAGFWLARKLDSPAPQLASGTWLPQARPLADFHLVNDAGQPFSAAQLQGAPSLVFFGFTHCPDVCPTTLAKLAQVKKTGALPQLRVLLVTIDPQRDTPPVLSQYVHAFDPQFIGLTGDTAAI